MTAQQHPLQAQRLAALRDYDILDTAREQDFDDVAQLASAICGTPISVINLIDAERQWFKAEVGLGVRETPLETSICAHVILDNEFVEINDTRTDDRLCDNALVQGDPGLRFYAGAQLITPEGLPLGTLCVLDHEPRTLTDLQREALRVLARQVMKQLELRRELRRAEILRREIDHRVKNSLQSVAALTRLHARSGITPEARAALETVVRRIETVAALHEQLYRTNAADRIDLSQYMQNVGGLLNGVRPDKVTLDIAMESVTLDSNRASAVAVLVNEFVQNSFVHAFPDGSGGTVDVAGRICGDTYVITMSDDGVGFAMDHRRPGGLGLAVIAASGQQLGGEYSRIEVPVGTRSEISFPLNG